jgi:rifampicin phosphotransferase
MAVRLSSRRLDGSWELEGGSLTHILTNRDAVDERAGGKARALASAARAGLPVPPFFVIPGDAVGTRLSADPQLPAEVAVALRRICPAGELVAVRSSARDEDGNQHSFAGQFESFLSIGPADLLDRVRDVCRSGSGDRILAYRRDRKLAGHASAPSVLVQRMVRARAAGVAFSADPVTGRRSIAVVTAVRGLGSALVSGEADADTWQFDRSGRIVERRIAFKRAMHVADPCSPGGVRLVDVAEAEANEPSLTDGEARAVADLVRRAARHFGRPQDIEWAYEDDRLLLVQSRPITSLESLPDPDAALAIWDNSNIVESYSGRTTPLTFSFASEIYDHVYRQFCRLMRVPEWVIADHDEAFRNMLGLVRGRLYYNLLNWYRILALLPGFALNRRFMEEMMGVGESLPTHVADGIARATAPTRIVDLVRLARTAFGLIASHLTLERRIRAFQRRLDDTLDVPDPPLEDRRVDELVAHYRDLRKRLLLSWDAPLVNDFFAMIFYGLLRKATKAWCGDRDGTLQNDLIGGDGGMASAEPALRLQHMARVASTRPELVSQLTGGAVDEIRAAMEKLPDFRSAVGSYLDEFGERTVNELKLESATLHDDPLPLFRSIGALARAMLERAGEGGTTHDRNAGEQLRARARQKVDSALRRRPARRTLFHWLVRQARARVRDRENLRLERTRLFGRVRRIFVEIGRRLHAQNLLDHPRDVFYLEVDEVLAFVEGRATTTDLRALTALRRREHLDYEHQIEPDARFETHGVVYQGHDFRSTSATPLPTGDERRGTGCSPGQVRGPVRIVTDPRAADLQQGSILVAEHTDPGWILAFPHASGLLVERGSLLSHAAIVARELGIPGVVSIPGLTRWLQDGDWVEFDGATGMIRRIADGCDERSVIAK